MCVRLNNQASQEKKQTLKQPCIHQQWPSCGLPCVCKNIEIRDNATPRPKSQNELSAHSSSSSHMVNKEQHYQITIMRRLNNSEKLFNIFQRDEWFFFRRVSEWERVKKTTREGRRHLSMYKYVIINLWHTLSIKTPWNEHAKSLLFK